ncbi:hypothetical protein NO2_0768 [Candidatus Termititenax persephonae]|uniref:PorV/PorQ family protein n=1 Tax=Candidatus Termititenax persephonae TaxID=2218525 RepID=A0A388TGE4_9BACT|nr:hypothetical protein NO2_0768 [Candidatus Termititenax persephonae]
MDNNLSARSLALGNVGVALLDASSAYLNPAIIKTQNHQTYQLTSAKVLDEVNYLAFTCSLGNTSFFDLGLGLSFLSSGVEDIQGTTYDEESGTAERTERFGYSGKAYILTTGYQITDTIFLGANLKSIQETLYHDSGSGLGLDVGLLWRPGSLAIGLSALNAVAPKLNWSTGWSEELNMRILGGISWQMLDNLGFYSQFESNGGLSYYGAGAEFVLFKMVALRAGYNPDHISIGTGLDTGSFTLDYAYLLNSDQEAGSSHYISFAYLFYGSQSRRSEDQGDRSKQKMQDAIKAEKERQSEETQTARVETAKTTLEKTAEIKPLPVQGGVVIETAVIDTANVTLDPADPIIIKLEETVDGTLLPTTMVNIVEGDRNNVFDYQISLITARYSEQNKRLQVSIYLDNIGNQPITVSANFRLLNAAGAVLQESKDLQTQLPIKDTRILRLPYDINLPSGTYYLEISSTAQGITRYQKDEYVKGAAGAPVSF